MLEKFKVGGPFNYIVSLSLDNFTILRISDHNYLETLLDQVLRLDIVTIPYNKSVELGEQRVLQLDLGLLL